MCICMCACVSWPDCNGEKASAVHTASVLFFFLKICMTFSFVELTWGVSVNERQS